MSKARSLLNTLISQSIAPDLADVAIEYLVDDPYEFIMYGTLPDPVEYNAIEAANVCVATNNIELFNACLSKFSRETGITGEYRSLELRNLIKNCMFLNRIDFVRALVDRYAALLPGYADVFRVKETKSFHSEYKTVVHDVQILIFDSLADAPFIGKVMEHYSALEYSILEDLLQAAAKNDDVELMLAFWTQLSVILSSPERDKVLARLLRISFLIGSRNVVKHFIERKIASPHIINVIVSAAFEGNDMEKASWLCLLLKNHYSVRCGSFIGNGYILPSHFTECIDLFGQACSISWFKEILSNHRQYPKLIEQINKYMTENRISLRVPRMSFGLRVSRNR